MKRINKNKKTYSKPHLDVIEVDHEISFIMMTSPPLDPPLSAFSVSPSAPASAPSSASPLLENDPFGGSSPDYSN